MLEQFADFSEHAKYFKEKNQSDESLLEHGAQLALAMYGEAYNFRKPNLPQDSLTPTHLMEQYRLR